MNIVFDQIYYIGAPAGGLFLILKENAVDLFRCCTDFVGSIAGYYRTRSRATTAAGFAGNFETTLNAMED